MKSNTWINLIVVTELLVASFGVMPYTQPVAQAAAIIRVKPDGSTSSGCGNTWANACDLQTALTNASTGDEIWVAAGTYKPGTNRDDTFQLVSGVALYGGFAGTETSRVQRDWEDNLSVLSGDIGVEGDNSDNIYTVVIGNSVDVTAILDGFTVTGGDNVGGAPTVQGGGISNSGILEITNSTLSDNSAGGVYNQGTLTLNNSTVSGNTGGGIDNRGTLNIINTTFDGNEGGWWGGGIKNNGTLILNRSSLAGNSADYGGGIHNSGMLEIINSTLSGNNADYGSGGGIYNNGTLEITNSTISNNNANNFGGGISNWGGSLEITNSTLSGNSSFSEGGGLHKTGIGQTILFNTIFANNTTVVNFGGNCQGFLIDGGHNIEDADTCSFDPVNGSLPNTDPLLGVLGNNGGPTLTHALLDGSPAIDSADPAHCPDHDQRSWLRPLDGDGDGVAICDIGSFEAGDFIKLYLPLIRG